MSKQIWAPWRIKYILKDKPDGCIFCEKLNEDDDEKNYIIERGTNSFSILNLYPYNNGHIMVVPNKHTSGIDDLDDNTLSEMMNLVKRSIKSLKNSLQPEGFNVGANIGKIAGAGIEDHVHIHIVPRWSADTNFMPILSNTDVIPEGLDETYNKIKKSLGDIND